MNEDDYGDLEKSVKRKPKTVQNVFSFLLALLSPFPAHPLLFSLSPEDLKKIRPPLQVGMLSAGAEFDLLQDQRWVRVRLSVRQEQRPSARSGKI